MGEKFIITQDGPRVVARIHGVTVTITPDEALELGAELTAASLEAFRAHRDAFEGKAEAQIETLVRVVADRRAEKVAVRS